MGSAEEEHIVLHPSNGNKAMMGTAAAGKEHTRRTLYPFAKQRLLDCSTRATETKQCLQLESLKLVTRWFQSNTKWAPRQRARKRKFIGSRQLVLSLGTTQCGQRFAHCESLQPRKAHCQRFNKPRQCPQWLQRVRNTHPRCVPSRATHASVSHLDAAEP